MDKGDIPYSARNDLLRHKVWTGLSSETLRLQTRHKYDTVRNYNELVRELGQVEEKITRSQPRPSNGSSTRPRRAAHKSAVASQMPSTSDEVIPGTLLILLVVIFVDVGVVVVVEETVVDVEEEVVSSLNNSLLNKVAIATKNKPPLLDVKSFNLDVSVADCAKLQVFGYIEATILVPCLTYFTIDVPVLVVPDGNPSPEVIGTNVIRRCKAVSFQETTQDSIPESWQTKFNALTSSSLPVRSTNRRAIEVGPYEIVVINSSEASPTVVVFCYRDSS
ncbi:uncharacterized protein LOC128221468 [Mya arenaria]|uniref:uncharacterized protein LOC128221468 n=1 Tax=Mya arenaria TaxID=6604 RepID=UPI0022E0414E|nr:uncharacterized protein LOC128221468 [Mya arenaria]